MLNAYGFDDLGVPHGVRPPSILLAAVVVVAVALWALFKFRWPL